MPESKKRKVNISQMAYTPRLNRLLKMHKRKPIDSKGSCLAAAVNYAYRAYFADEENPGENQHIAFIENFMGCSSSYLLSLTSETGSFNNILGFTNRINDLNAPQKNLGLPFNQFEVATTLNFINSKRVNIYTEFALGFFFTKEELLDIFNDIFKALDDQKAMFIFNGIFEEKDADPGEHTVSAFRAKGVASYYDANEEDKPVSFLGTTNLIEQFRNSFTPDQPPSNALIPLSIYILSDRPRASQPKYPHPLEIIQNIIKAHPERINAIHPKTGRTALQFMVEAGDLEMCQKLINEGANPNIADNEGLLPIHEATIFDRLDLVKFFLAKTTKGKNVLDNMGSSLLMYSVADLNLGQVMQFLLDQGVDVNLQNIDGDSALHWAADANHAMAVELLLKAGAQIDVKNKDEMTPLMAAAFSGNLNAIHSLLQAGASLDFKDQMSISAWRLALGRGHWACAEAILAQGADIDEKNATGRTALFNAVHQEEIEYINFLLQHGADPNITNSKGTTALMLAIKGGNLGVVQAICEHSRHNLDLDAAFEEAEYKHHQNIIHYLQEFVKDRQAKEIEKKRFEVSVKAMQALAQQILSSEKWPPAEFSAEEISANSSIFTLASS